MEVIQLGKERFCTGLFWQTLDSTDKHAVERVSTELNEGVENRAPFDAYVLRTGKVSQAGFATAGPKPARLSSVAAALAAAGGTWRGRFILAEGTYVFAMVQGAILPHGDQYLSQEAAEEAWQDLTDQAEWEREEDHSEGAAGIPALQSLVNAVKVIPTLQPLSKPFPTGKVVLLILAIALGIGGVHFYRERERHEAMQAARASLASARAQLVARQHALAVAAQKSRPWAGTPMPSTVLDRCATDYAGVHLYSNGWMLARWECSPSRDISTWVWPEAVSFDRLPAGATFDPSTPRTTYGIREHGQSLPEREVLGQALNKSEAALALFAYAAHTEASNVQLTWQAPPPVKGAPPAQVYLTGNFKVVLPMNPFETGEDMDRIPGLTIQSLRVDIQNLNQGNWTMEGDIYAIQ